MPSLRIRLIYVSLSAAYVISMYYLTASHVHLNHIAKYCNEKSNLT